MAIVGIVLIVLGILVFVAIEVYSRSSLSMSSETYRILQFVNPLVGAVVQIIGIVLVIISRR
jgi:hypothetical protein